MRTNEKIAAMLAELAQEQGITGAVAAGLTDPDEIPEPPDEATTKPGDVWLLVRPLDFRDHIEGCRKP